MRPAIAALAAVLAAALPGAAVAAESDSLLLGLPTDDSIPREIKDAAQQVVARTLSAPHKQVFDTELQSYLLRLTRRLEPSEDYYTGIIANGTLNAFAGVGGVIMVHSGLWLAAESEAQLAGVVAHEIAHQKLRHIERDIEDSAEETGLSIAAAAAGLLVGNPALRDALILSSPGIYTSGQLERSREFETEADAIGFEMLAKAGIDPNGLVEFLTKIKSLEGGSTNPEYLRSHPLSTKRIAMLKNRIGDKSFASGDAPGIDFQLLRRKLSVLTNAGERNIAKQLEDLRQTSLVAFSEGKVVNLYELILVSARQRDWEAFGTGEKLIRAARIRHPMIDAALIEGRMLANRTEDAALLAAEAAKSFPDHPALAILHARTVGARDPAESLRLVRGYMGEFDTLAALRRAEAELLSSLGRKIEHHLRLADLYLASGDVKAAHKQIKVAQRLGEEGPATPSERRMIAETQRSFDRYKAALEEIFAS